MIENQRLFLKITEPRSFISKWPITVSLALCLIIAVVAHLYLSALANPYDDQGIRDAAGILYFVISTIGLCVIPTVFFILTIYQTIQVIYSDARAIFLIENLNSTDVVLGLFVSTLITLRGLLVLCLGLLATFSFTYAYITTIGVGCPLLVGYSCIDYLHALPWLAFWDVVRCLGLFIFSIAIGIFFALKFSNYEKIAYIVAIAALLAFSVLVGLILPFRSAYGLIPPISLTPFLLAVLTAIFARRYVWTTA